MTEKKVVIIADLFSYEISGGSELYVEELLKCLGETYECVKIKSGDVSVEFIQQHKEYFFIVSNHKLLSEQAKQELMKNEYVILEHDWHFVKSNNPALYSNLVVPEEQLQEKDFYKKAKYVLCQSKLHAEITRKNLLLKNILNLGCNLWSKQHFKWLRENLNQKKTRKYGVMESSNKNKGTPQTIEYCRNNNILFELIPPCHTQNFYQELAKTETLVFMPQWCETFNRVAVEARILGCKLIINKMLGSTSEEYFKFKGEELLDEIELENERVISLFRHIIDGSKLITLPELNLPKVSVITTIYNGKEFIKGYLDAFIEQTYKDKELIIVDANSDDGSDEIIREYQKDHSEIIYLKLDEKVIPPVAFNKATELARGEYIVCCLVDDRMSKEYIETMTKHLYLDPSVDLVYSDHYQTTKPNETFDKNSSKNRLYEHSRMEFSPENMIKSLPGCIQMYRKSVVEKYGKWNESLKYACDWEYWLRMVRNGAKFKKINKVLGLYYFSPKGLSTGQEHMLNKRKEERDVFNEYKDVIGNKNYDLYKEYFNAV